MSGKKPVSSLILIGGDAVDHEIIQECLLFNEWTIKVDHCRLEELQAVQPPPGLIIFFADDKPKLAGQFVKWLTAMGTFYSLPTILVGSQLDVSEFTVTQGYFCGLPGPLSVDTLLTTLKEIAHDPFIVHADSFILNKAVWSMAGGRIAAAISILNSSEFSNPRLELVRKYLLTWAELRRFHLKGALDSLKPLLAMHPRDPHANLLASHFYLLQGKFEGALTHLDRALVEFPKNFLVRKWRADILMAQEHYGDAKEIYGSLVTAGRLLNEEIHKKLAGIAALTGDFDNLEQVTSGDYQETIKLMNNNAVDMVKARRFDLAKRLYLIALERSTEDVKYKVFLNLGLCMKKAGDRSEAEHYFRKSKENAPRGFTKADQQLEKLQNSRTSV